MPRQNNSTPLWSLATVATKTGPVACIEVDDGLYDLQASLRRVGEGAADNSVLALFDNWELSHELLNKASVTLDQQDRVDSEIRLAPLLYPGKILCAGANYFRHLAEMGVEGATKKNQRLFFFMKPPRNAVVGEGSTVQMPLDTQMFDWEIELTAVIGKRARAVSVSDALNYVGGYTVAIDFSARDLNRAPETFYKLDWVAGKAQDTCCPMGPRIVPASHIADPQNLHLRLSVNGAIKQDDTTGDMIFSLAEQIATASRIMTLDPGDIILTGTPAGVGVPRKEFLKIGDVVDAEIEGIGKLSVTIQPVSDT